MGYIQIPKLVGGSDEPTITVRDMPDEWKFFTTLKESDKDQAFLFYKNGSGGFEIGDLVSYPNVAYATLYGGTNGTTPLYRCYWGSSSSKKYWTHYENGEWVKNTNQPSSTGFNYFMLRQADLDNYPEPDPLDLYKLTGKPVTNDPHIGNNELFAFIIHTSNTDYVRTRFNVGTADSGNTSNSLLTTPLLAYSGGAHCLKSSVNVRIPDLEFVEMLGGDKIYQEFAASTYWLGKIIMPDTVTTVETATMQNSLALQEVKLSSLMTSIPDNTFNSCINLKKVTMPTGLLSIGNSAFVNTYNLKKLVLPNTVTSVGNSTFSSSGIETINFPNSLTTIGDYSFQDCNIKEAILPNTITSMGQSVFAACKKLKRATIPSSVVDVPSSIFNSCVALEEVTIPSGIQTIGASVFSGCSLLKSVTLPNTLTSMATNVFSECENLEKIVIPNGCTLGTYNFSSCYNLIDVTLPNDLVAMPNYCFQNCRGVKEWNLPNTLQTIGISSFQNNWNIKKMIIPATVTSIGANAFSTMGSCRYVKMLGSTPTLSNASAFASGNTKVKILVPYDYIHDYRTSTNWSSSTNSIKNKQRGYKTFTQGETLPSTDSSGSHTLKWYEHLEDILNTTTTGTPSASQITVAPYDGEFYCTITG